MFGPALGARLIATVAAGPRGASSISSSGWALPAMPPDRLDPAGDLGGRARSSSPCGCSSGSGAARRWNCCRARRLAQLTGSTRYCGGLIDRRGGSVQPLSYVRGLAQAVLRAGGQIFTHSPALRLSRDASGYRIQTPAGESHGAARHRRHQCLHRRARRTSCGARSCRCRRSRWRRRRFRPSCARSILPGGQAASDTWRLLRYFRARCERTPRDGHARHVRGGAHDAHRASSLPRRARDLSAAARAWFRVSLGRLRRDDARSPAAPARTCARTPGGPRLQWPRRRDGHGHGTAAGAAGARGAGRRPWASR